MKVTKASVKKHARKIKDVTEEEFGELQEGYKKLMGNVQTMSSPGLLGLSFLGILIILYFRNNFFDLIGLVISVYPLYIFIQNTSHEEGFFEGYYDKMKTGSAKAEDGEDGKGKKSEQHRAGKEAKE